MSWLFSQALVGEFLAARCSDGEPSAPSSGSPTPRAYLPSDRMMAFSRLSRFGMTFGPLTDGLGTALLTWFLGDFRARTSALPGKAPESTESAADYGGRWRELWAKFDPDTSLWRTLQPSLLGDSDELSVTWPRSGMTADGRCWALEMLGRRTSETGFGSLLPTPCTVDTGSMFNRSASAGAALRPTLGAMARFYLWPTPKNSDHRIGIPERNKGSQSLNGRRSNLNDAAASTVVKLTDRKPTDPQVGLADQVGGKLNPTWVEWLMGWPLGWTDLKLLVTDKSHCAPQQPGES